jgi:cytochrome c553
MNNNTLLEMVVYILTKTVMFELACLLVLVFDIWFHPPQVASLATVSAMPNRKRGSFHASDSGSTIQIGTHKDGRRTHTLTTDGNIVRNANPGSSRNSVCARLRDGHDVIFPTNPNHIASRKLTVKTVRKATARARQAGTSRRRPLSFVPKCSDSMAKSTASQANLASCGSCHQIDSSGLWRLFQVRLQDATLQHH